MMPIYKRWPVLLPDLLSNLQPDLRMYDSTPQARSFGKISS